MKTLLTTIFFILVASNSHCETLLWSKTYDNSGMYGQWSVGTDGTTAFIDIYWNEANRKKILGGIYWYDRNGIEITPINASYPHAQFSGILYVSSDELVVAFVDFYGDQKVELFQFNSSGTLESRIVDVSNSGSDSSRFKYPYMLSYKIEANNDDSTRDILVKFYDLTNENNLKIVGDAVTGIHGNNLKVRWKTIASAKYKVQTSTDLNNWTDYTEIIDGNGATMIVNIAIGENDESLYARVVKL